MRASSQLIKTNRNIMSTDKDDSPRQKTVLFLGNADSEGVTAQLRAAGTLYKKKILDSSPENWESIISIFQEYDVSCVVVKLTRSTFTNFCMKEYSELRMELLTLISLRPNLFLAHESLLTGEQDQSYVEYISKKYNYDVEDDPDHIASFYSSVFAPPPAEVRQEVAELLSSFGIDVVPYEKNVDFVVVASVFVEMQEKNLIFRIYVPSERMWANEAEKLLQLFREYLQKVSGLNVRHDQHRTNQGVVYEFFGGDSLASGSLPEAFDKFSSFMDMCASNPEHAKDLLASANLNKVEVFNLVERYSKEARRLHVDIKQERERKLLAIRHSLESDLAEHVRTEHDWNIINRVIEGSVPPVSGVLSAFAIDRRPLPEAYKNLTINISPQIIDTVHGVVAQQIFGNQYLGPDALQLLEIIEQYAGANKTSLASAVHELSDGSASSEDRITAKQRLKGFLFSVAGKIGDVAAGVLQSYIEGQVGL
jgi:hypothetical protein